MSAILSFFSSVWNWLRSDNPQAAVIRGALVAITGALLTIAYQWATSTDFGPTWTPIVVMVVSVAVNAVRKYLGLLSTTDNTKS